MVVEVLVLPLLALVVVLDVRLQPDLGSIIFTLSLLGLRLHAGRSGDVLTPRDHRLDPGRPAGGGCEGVYILLSPRDHRLDPGRPAGGGGGGVYILFCPLLLLLLLYVDVPL